MKAIHYRIGFLAVIAVIGFFALLPKLGNANPFYVNSIVTTGGGSDATSTAQYFSTGVGTSTVAIDTYSSGQNTNYDSALVSMVYTATSTVNSPSFNMRAEYAVGLAGTNCATNQSACDWFPFNAIVSSNASTSIMTQNYADYHFQVSTSTAFLDLGGSSYYAAPTSTTMTSVQVVVPARYIRFKFYVPVGGGRGSIWAGILPIRQRP